MQVVVPTQILQVKIMKNKRTSSILLERLLGIDQDDDLPFNYAWTLLLITMLTNKEPSLLTLMISEDFL